MSATAACELGLASNAAAQHLSGYWKKPFETAADETPPMVPKGKGHGRVEDRYVFGRVLGMGAHSVVRAVTDMETGKQWACKCLKVELPGKGSSAVALGAAKPRKLRAVFLEIDLLLRLRHDGVAQIREWFQESDKVYIIIEYCKGKDVLQSIVSQPCGRFSETESRSLTVQMLEVLQYINDHDIVHRDLKLENVLCTPSPEGTRVKLLDFSLAADTLDGPITGSCGTSYYAAPEVIFCENPDGGYGKECDMWSLGVMLFVMLCGEMPFFSEDMDAIHSSILMGQYEMSAPSWNGVTEEAKDLVRKMLDVNPGSRITPRDALNHPWSLV